VIGYRTYRRSIGWGVIEPIGIAPLRGASGCTLGPYCSPMPRAMEDWRCEKMWDEKCERGTGAGKDGGWQLIGYWRMAGEGPWVVTASEREWESDLSQVLDPPRLLERSEERERGRECESV